MDGISRVVWPPGVSAARLWKQLAALVAGRQVPARPGLGGESRSRVQGWSQGWGRWRQELPRPWNVYWEGCSGSAERPLSSRSRGSPGCTILTPAPCRELCTCCL